MELTINVYHHFVNGAPHSNADVLAEIKKLGAKMSKTDDQIAVFKADVDTKLAVIQGSLGTMAAAQVNIAADEAKILDQLKNMPTDGLSAESLAILAGVTASLGTAADSSKAQADSLQKLADSIPDTAIQP